MDPLQSIMEERARQDEKWGEQNHNDTYWLGIIMEELGECARYCIERQHPTNRARKRTELVQVAAVALAWLECLDRKEELLSKPNPPWADA
jgi:hypothetical protein